VLKLEGLSIFPCMTSERIAEDLKTFEDSGSPST
jgi:hypothetical protein